MRYLPHHPDGPQVRCFAILKSCWQGDSRGPISLEDHQRYWLTVSEGIDQDGEEILRLSARPHTLSKTPLSSCHLELVTALNQGRAGRAKRPRSFLTVLRRTSPKVHDWQSDFVGAIALPGERHYLIGITITTDWGGEQILRVYFRPVHLYKTPPEDAGRLEVV